MSFDYRLIKRDVSFISSEVQTPATAKQPVSELPKTGIANTPDKFEAATSLEPPFSEMGQKETLTLQMSMDRRSKMMSTLSNLLKKISDTSSTITSKLK